MLESSLAPISTHIEERLELLESMINMEGEGMEENNRHSKRSAEPLAEQVKSFIIQPNPSVKSKL